MPVLRPQLWGESMEMAGVMRLLLVTATQYNESPPPRHSEGRDACTAP